jgi:hypothetical protein
MSILKHAKSLITKRINLMTMNSEPTKSETNSPATPASPSLVPLADPVKPPPAKSVPTEARHNCLVHGVYAQDLVLPWEDKMTVEALHRDLKAEWKPQGPSEEEQVFTITYLTVQKRRLIHHSQAMMSRDPLIAELKSAGVKSWGEVIAHQTKRGDLRDELKEKCMGALDEIKSAVAKAGQRMTIPDTTSHEVHKEVSGLQDLFMKGVVGNVHTFLNREKSTQAEQNAFSPEQLEKLNRLDSSLDARIAKAIGLLVNIQDRKRLMAASATKHLEDKTR